MDELLNVMDELLNVMDEVLNVMDEVLNVMDELRGHTGGAGVSSCMYNTPKYLLQEILDTQVN
jgi:hypothetical protein